MTRDWPAPRPACPGDDGAELQHRDAIGQVHDEFHVVFHHQHGQAFGPQLGQQLGQGLLLEVAQAGGRLVQQQQEGWPASARAISTMRCWPRAARPRCRCTGPGRSARSGGGPRPAGLPPRRDRAQHGRQPATPRPQVRAHGHVLEHAALAQQAHVLEGAAQPQRGKGARGLAGHGLAQQGDVPEVGRPRPRSC
jgi:hypothetical protein